MNILILGSGASEYAFVSRLNLDENVKNIFVYPGNLTMSKIAKILPKMDYEELLRFALENKISLCVVLDQIALTNGLCDMLREADISVIGASQRLSKLSNFKNYSKKFFKTLDIKTPKYIFTADFDEACDFIDTLGSLVLIKKDGISEDGVFIAKNHDEAKEKVFDILDQNDFGKNANGIIIEEFIYGTEFSFTALCAGENLISLPLIRNFRKSSSEIISKNTKNLASLMPFMDENFALKAKIKNDIVKPILAALNEANSPVLGFINLDFILSGETLYAIKINLGLKDTQVVGLMPLIDGNLSLILYNAASKRQLSQIVIKKEYSIALKIFDENFKNTNNSQSIKLKAILENTQICYNQVSFDEDGNLLSIGENPIIISSKDKNFKNAKNKALKLCENIEFNGKRYLKEIEI